MWWYTLFIHTYLFKQAKNGELWAKARQRVDEIRRLQTVGLIAEGELLAGYAFLQDGYTLNSCLLEGSEYE